MHREKRAFPDLKMAINLLVARGDFVSVVWIFSLPPCLQAAHHSRWFLLAAAVATVVGAIILERLVGRLLRSAWRRSRYHVA